MRSLPLAMFSTMITVVESDPQTKTVTSNNKNNNNEDHNTTGGITNKQTMPSIFAVAHNTINNKSLALIHKPDPAPEPPVSKPVTGVFVPKSEPVPHPPTPDPHPPPPPIFWKALGVYMMAPVHPAM
ncbi:hypothetical protein E4T42_07658 [Aureobasidium subglaciale]|nr:hypothetical protein E4T42_07658 [Aureobasidium subglaciale]